MSIILIIQTALSEKMKTDLAVRSSKPNKLAESYLVPELRGVIFFISSPIP